MGRPARSPLARPRAAGLEGETACASFVAQAVLGLPLPPVFPPRAADLEGDCTIASFDAMVVLPLPFVFLFSASAAKTGKSKRIRPIGQGCDRRGGRGVGRTGSAGHAEGFTYLVAGVALDRFRHVFRNRFPRRHTRAGVRRAPGPAPCQTGGRPARKVGPRRDSAPPEYRQARLAKNPAGGDPLTRRTTPAGYMPEASRSYVVIPVRAWNAPGCSTAKSPRQVILTST